MAKKEKAGEKPVPSAEERSGYTDYGEFDSAVIYTDYAYLLTARRGAASLGLL